MKLKVCGMRDRENIHGLGQLDIDFIGLIFYEKSQRFVLNEEDLISGFPHTIKKVGVFVNAELDYVLKKVDRLGLDYVQLHGGESIEFCKALKKQGIGVIKVFSVSDELPKDLIDQYEPCVDFFLFDTKTSKYGGSGLKFNWDLLKDYSLNIPYFLSGGIGEEDVNDIVERNLPGLYAIDINSGVEIKPGLKDLNKVKLISELVKEHPSESPLKGRGPSINTGNPLFDKHINRNRTLEGVDSRNSPLEGGKGGVKTRNRIIPHKPYLKRKARELRKNSTSSEIFLWMELKNRQIRGYQFHRQVPMLDYIVDFYCHELSLVIEVDGDSHDNKVGSDQIRQSEIENYGVSFLRFDDLDVKQNLEFVLKEIGNWIADHE